MDVEKAIREYLQQVIHMSLATCRDNSPWVCEVHFVYDDELNLYFRSTPARRHSEEIADNPHVAGNIVTQHHAGQKVRGVYFEGRAAKLAAVDENHVAYIEYCKRLGTGPEILEEAASDTGHGFYQISVSDFYLFDSYITNPSQKFHLPWGHPSN
ncbi:MAG TPA: pyridoxamine 5'-phosphate oxidase family protein [Candidatus Saccharimonadia bacterium]|nr:pyridoxamine 5'-phosphate oxidase family protein [Candidatus Saccharimonadia bacterium]